MADKRKVSLVATSIAESFTDLCTLRKDGASNDCWMSRRDVDLVGKLFTSAELSQKVRAMLARRSD